MDSITATQELISHGDVIIIQRQGYMKTHKLINAESKKASTVQLGKMWLYN